METELPPPEQLADLPAFLLLFDGLVRRDGAATGLNGEVCLGVKVKDNYHWWRARFGRRFECGFIAEVSPTAQATLCLGQTEADSLLKTGRLPPSAQLFTFSGDRQLFDAFIKRYTSRTNWLGLQLRK